MISWKIVVRLVGRLPVAGSAAALALALVLAVIARQTGGAPPSYARTVALVVSLAVGLQSAFVLSPSDEPALEILLTSPSSAPAILVERLAVVGAMQGGVALIASAIGLIVLSEGNSLLIVPGWLAPSVCLGGVALLATQLIRQGAIGALLTMMLWGGMTVGGDAMLARWPTLWPLHLFLQPEQTSPAVYALNRAALILLGLVLIALAARLTRNEEHMLGIRSASPKKG